jgi:hypothetical protein
MLDNPLCHCLLRNNTFMSQVEVDIILHNVLHVGSYDILLDIFLFQILLYLILHLCIHLYLILVCCIEVLDYTMHGYIVVLCYYIEVTQCFTTVVHYYMEVVPG